MAFQVFTPTGGPGGGIPRGMLSLTSRGMGRFNGSDLAAVGIAERATILIDRERHSMALRGPLECEPGQTVGAEKNERARTIWLAGAMRAVGLEPAEFHGWSVCRVVEDRLEIEFKASGTARRRKG